MSSTIWLLLPVRGEENEGAAGVDGEEGAAGVAGELDEELFCAKTVRGLCHNIHRKC